MPKPRIRFMTVAVALFAGALALMFLGSKPRVTATVIGYTTNELLEALIAERGTPKYVCAIVAVTNHSKQTVIYSAHAVLPTVEHDVLQWTLQGWEHGALGVDSGKIYNLRQQTLRPGERFDFQAIVERGNVSRILFNYGSQPSRIRQWLPDWLRARLPQPAALSATATTDSIDLSKMPVGPPSPGTILPPTS